MINPFPVIDGIKIQKFILTINGSFIPDVSCTSEDRNRVGSSCGKKAGYKISEGPHILELKLCEAIDCFRAKKYGI